MLCPTRYVFEHSNPYIWNAVLSSFAFHYGEDTSIEYSKSLTGVVMFFIEDERVKYKKSLNDSVFSRTHILLMTNRVGVWWYDVVDRIIMCRWFDELSINVDPLNRRIRGKLLQLCRMCNAQKNHMVIITRDYIQVEDLRLPIRVTDGAIVWLIDSIL